MNLFKDIDESHEIEEEDTSNMTDTSTSEDDEDESVCSIVMSTSDNDQLDTSDLMKNYALMLEVPTALTTSNEQN